MVCFDSLVEISLNKDAILEFARRHDIDNKYLVDGANFVISKMHFNPENNYYITMGLPQNISPEEIRERWKKLMLLYHPDRQGGNESWVSERAKKVNEAYSILKDEEKRRSFDRKLLEKTMAGRPAHLYRTTAVATPSRRSSRKISKDPEWDRKKKSIPKILIGLYIIAALAFLCYIYLQNNAVLLESALSRKDLPAGQARLSPDNAPEKEIQNIIIPAEQAQPQKEINRGSIKQQQLTPLNQVSEKRNTAGHTVASDPAKAVGPAPDKTEKADGAIEKYRNGTDKPISGENSGTKKTEAILSPPAASAPGPQSGSKEQAHKPYVHTLSPETGYSTKKTVPAPASAQETAASVKPSENIKTNELTREEVENFMKQYSSAYLSGDLNAFMSLISRSVLENNSLHYNEVREAYRQTFSEKIKFYRINNMKIMLNGINASVTGLYDMNRYSSAEDRWIGYSGKIQWKITKENNEMKIISLNYDK